MVKEWISDLKEGLQYTGIILIACVSALWLSLIRKNKNTNI